MTTLYLSHGARNDESTPEAKDWFIVEPRGDATQTSMAGTPVTQDDAVRSLQEAGRIVLRVEVEEDEVYAIEQALS